MRQFIWAAAILAMATSASFGTVLLTDSFSYADGALNTVAPAPTWGIHSGTGAQVVVSGRALIDDNIGADHNTRFASITTGALYAGFTANVTSADLPTTASTSTSGYFLHFAEQGATAAPALSTAFRARVWAVPGVAAGTIRFALSTTSGVATAYTSDLAPDTDYRLVVSYDFGTSTSQLWVNPANGSAPATLTGAVDASPIAAGLGAIALRGSSNDGDVYVDNLIVATTLGEVVPEPAAVTLLALGGLLFARRRNG